MLTSETASGLHSPAIDLDWSYLFTMHPSRETQTNISSFLEWVATYPERSRIHVYLGGNVQTRYTRRVRQQLQSYGCRVTARCPMTTLPA